MSTSEVLNTEWMEIDGSRHYRHEHSLTEFAMDLRCSVTGSCEGTFTENELDLRCEYLKWRIQMWREATYRSGDFWISAYDESIRQMCKAAIAGYEQLRG